ncbi:MAG: hypothetical protein H7256_06715 [Bdellovibrio sp.]|nr:hypothetical protein [Bdellovibrio sp.]
MVNLNKFRFLSLTYPYEMLAEQNVGKLFNQILTLKLRGYQHEYPAGVLPIDTTDFISIHHVVCLELKNELRPVMAFKTTPLSRALKHQINFPALSLAQQAGAPEHAKAVEKIMANCLEEKKELAYASSWTIDPVFRKDKQLRGLLEASYILGHKDYNIQEVLLGGTLRFKTENIFARMGHTLLKNENDEALPLINVKHLFGEQVVIMHSQKLTPYADECCAPFQAMWDDRIEISPTTKDATLRKLLIAA